MITVLYYEVLNIRDEVWVMMQSISNEKSPEEDRSRKETYNKFLEKESLSGNTELSASDIVAEAENDAAKAKENNDKNT